MLRITSGPRSLHREGRPLKLLVVLSCLAGALVASSTTEPANSAPHHPSCHGMADVGSVIGNIRSSSGVRGELTAEATVYLVTTGVHSYRVGGLLLDQKGDAWVSLNARADQRTASWFHVPYGKLPVTDWDGTKYSDLILQPRLLLPSWLYLRACDSDQFRTTQ